MDFIGSVNGISDLERTFNNLPKSTQRKAYTQSLKKGAYVVRRLAVGNLKGVLSGQSTGLLEKNIRVYALRKYKGYFRVGVQVKRGLLNDKKIVNGKPVRVGLYASVLEYGKKGQPPRTWIRKAIREGKDAALTALSQEMKLRMVDAIEDAKK